MMKKNKTKTKKTINEDECYSLNQPLGTILNLFSYFGILPLGS